MVHRYIVGELDFWFDGVSGRYRKELKMADAIATAIFGGLFRCLLLFMKVGVLPAPLLVRIHHSESFHSEERHWMDFLE